MATARVDMKGYFKQQKKGRGGVSKPSSKKGNNKTPSHSPALASLDLQGDYDAKEEVLRQFDMNMAYGPCFGMTRLERWTRAYKLGLNPPKEAENLLKAGKVNFGCLWDGRI